MPTYNYYCKKCDSYFSYFQNINEIAKEKCENCNDNIKRVITGGSGLIFKGSGFYLTDYKDQKHNDSKNKNDTLKKSKKDKIPIKENKNKSKKVDKNE